MHIPSFSPSLILSLDFLLRLPHFSQRQLGAIPTAAGDDVMAYGWAQEHVKAQRAHIGPSQQKI
jgi:hypothetical protein